jgi:hypothetical protein
MLTLIAWLERIGQTEIYLMDNDSTFPPLLQYYRGTKYKVIDLGANLGPHAFWKSGLLESMNITGRFILTDPDVVPTEDCPDNAIEVLASALDQFPDRVKAGFGLRIDDLPDHYPRKAEVVRWERQYFNKELAPGLYDANIDTTFALYRPKQPFSYGPSLRTGAPYLFRHLPWYTDPARMSDEEAFYLRSVTASTHWHLSPQEPEMPDRDSSANDVLVIVPSRSRPDSCVEFAEAFFEHSTRSDLVFVLDDDDPMPYPRLDGVKYEVLPHLRFVSKMNVAATKYVDHYRYLAFLGDDTRIRTPAWDRTLVEEIEDLPTGIAYGNDLLQGPALPTALLMKSDIVRVLGFMFLPGLVHLYVDNVWRDLGMALGSLRYRDDVIIEHLHFTAGKSEVDAIYQEGNSSDMYARDHAAYLAYIRSRLELDVAKLKLLLIDKPLERASARSDKQPATANREEPSGIPAGPIKILKATYGNRDCQADVTTQLQDLALKGVSRIPASNNLFGDPCPNRGKSLRLTYQLPGSDRQFTHEVREHQDMWLPALASDGAQTSFAE